MDFYTSLAINVLLQVLADKKQLPKFRRALLKVFKAILVSFAHDEEFQAEMRRFVVAPEF